MAPSGDSHAHAPILLPQLCNMLQFREYRTKSFSTLNVVTFAIQWYDSGSIFMSLGPPLQLIGRPTARVMH